MAMKNNFIFLFSSNRVLGLSKGIEYPGPPQWELVGCLILSWVCVYFCVWKGVKSSGKVVYFTACFPYVMIFCLVIRGLTLPGAFTGLLFYVKPDFSKLVDSQIWMDAGTQVFYSYAICFGCQMAMGSYNKYHRLVLLNIIYFSTRYWSYLKWNKDNSFGLKFH